MDANLFLQWQASALQALHEAAEAYLTTFLTHAGLVAIHSKRVTVMRRDIDLVKSLRGWSSRTDDIGDMRGYVL